MNIKVSSFLKQLVSFRKTLCTLMLSCSLLPHSACFDNQQTSSHVNASGQSDDNEWAYTKSLDVGGCDQEQTQFISISTDLKIGAADEAALEYKGGIKYQTPLQIDIEYVANEPLRDEDTRSAFIAGIGQTFKGSRSYKPFLNKNMPLNDYPFQGTLNLTSSILKAIVGIEQDVPLNLTKLTFASAKQNDAPLTPTLLFRSIKSDLTVDYSFSLANEQRVSPRAVCLDKNTKYNKRLSPAKTYSTTGITADIALHNCPSRLFQRALVLYVDPRFEFGDYAFEYKVGNQRKRTGNEKSYKNSDSQFGIYFNEPDLEVSEQSLERYLHVEFTDSALTSPPDDSWLFEYQTYCVLVGAVDWLDNPQPAN